MDTTKARQDNLKSQSDVISPVWEDPEIPWPHRWFGTVRSIFITPSNMFNSMRIDGGVFLPLMFASIGILIQAVFVSLYLDKTFDFQNILLRFVGPIIGIFIYAAVLHLMLLIIQAHPRSFDATVRLITYTVGVTCLAAVIPVVGIIGGKLWGLVLVVIGIKHVHKTTFLKAIISLLIPVMFAIFIAIASSIAMSHFGDRAKESFDKVTATMEEMNRQSPQGNLNK